MIHLTINDTPVKVPKGTTILHAARQAGVRIPTLCYVERLQAIGACRVCVVEIEGMINLAASCSMPVAEGMQVRTNTRRVRQARQLVVELLLSEHDGDCQTCDRREDCELQGLSAELGIRTISYAGQKTRKRIDLSTPGLMRDHGKCIKCRRCVSVCAETQHVGALWAQGRGFDTAIGPAFNRDLNTVACVQCGQCAAVCPVGAITEQSHIDRVWDAIDDPHKHVVVQTAPAIRAALGECFGYPPGTLVTGKMTTALRRLGFDAVFDTNFAADVTIMEEGTELLTRLRRALVDKQAGGPADVHQLLTGLDPVCRVFSPPDPAQPVDLQVAAADVRRAGQDLLRRKTRPEARADLRHVGDALHGQEVRVPAAGNVRQRRPGCGCGAYHARTRQDDPLGRDRLLLPARRGKWTHRWDSRPVRPTSSPTRAVSWKRLCARPMKS